MRTTPPKGGSRNPFIFNGCSDSGEVLTWPGHFDIMGARSPINPLSKRGKVSPCGAGSRNRSAGPPCHPANPSRHPKGVELRMTLSVKPERSAVQTRDADLPDPGKDKEKKSSGTAIPFPCCPKEKVVVYPGIKGSASSKCPNCGKYALFNYDNLTATPGEVCRGASKRSRAGKN